jgi:hypothetical protein
VQGSGVGTASPSSLSILHTLNEAEVKALREEMEEVKKSGKLLHFENFEVSESGDIEPIAKVGQLSTHGLNLITPNGEHASVYMTGLNGIIGKRSWYWLSTHEYKIIDP